MTVWE